MSNQVELQNSRKSSNRALFTLGMWLVVFAGFYYRLYMTHDMVDSIKFSQDRRDEKDYEFMKTQTVIGKNSLEEISKALFDINTKLGEICSQIYKFCLD